MSKSFKKFEHLLLTHSVDRPPHSVLVFSRTDVESILKFMTNQYYRMWHVYKTACSKPGRVITSFTQTSVGDVEAPQEFFRTNRGLDKAEESNIVVTFPEPMEETGDEEKAGGEGGEEGDEQDREDEEKKE